METLKTMEFGPYEWLVIAEEDGRKLLLSKYAVDARAWHEDDGKDSGDVTWENCSLRTWLDTEFVSRFSTVERTQIIPVENRNPATSGNENVFRVTLPEGASTIDRVFLLSLEEIHRYLEEYIAADRASVYEPSEGSFTPGILTCFPHESVKDLKIDETFRDSQVRAPFGAWSWWTRSSGVHTDRCLTAYGAFAFGKNKSYPLKVPGNRPIHYQLGVRPAMWIVRK